MRKYFLSFVALAAGLFATSCQESIVEPQVGGTTTFTVQVPDQMGTKADPTLGSAANVNQLFVAVYADASDANAAPIYRAVAPVSNGQASVSLNLIQGQYYDVIFWAQVDNNYVSAVQTDNEYNFDLVNIPMNKNYHNTDAGAAFFYYWDNFQPTGTSQPVTLRRPFAQLNLGTTEGSLTNNAGTFTLQSSVIKVKGIADNFNTVSGFGTVTEANKDIEYTFDAVALPSDKKINVAGEDYMYVSMDYLPIVGDDQALITVDATITLSNNQSINHKFTNVPVRENYRTNIVGNLISSSTDFVVTIEEGFVKDDKYGVLDGKVYERVYNSEEFNDAFENDDIDMIILESNIDLKQTLTRATTSGDYTLTISAEKELIIDLNGKELSATSSQTGKNYNMFDVRGTLTVKNGTMKYEHLGDNMEWNNSTNLFNVTAGGILNLEGVTAENLGGSDMAFVAHLNNWGECTLNVENSTLTSSYIAVRLFNSGYDMNNVSIKNTELQGKYCFWVHNYQDAGDNVGTDETLNLNIYNNKENPDLGCKNIFTFASKAPVLFGFADPIYYDEFGQEILQLVPITDSNGDVVSGVAYDPESIDEDVNGNTIYTTILVTEEDGLVWISENVETNKGFEGMTIKLDKDINLEGKTFSPIGYDPEKGEATEFKGIFDGNNCTIKGLNQQDLQGGYTQSVGLFAKVNNATIKNLILEDIVAAKYGAEAGAVASIATGNCTFEGIEVVSGSIVAYNNDAAAILGWANVGNFTFKDITIGSDVTVHSLWNSYDTSVGGVIGTLKSGSTATFENINVSCKLDVYNDVCSNYQWGAYRRTGMLIGNMSETQTIEGTTYPNPEAAGVTCNNVFVTYGEWMNYHYCEFKANGHGSYDDEFTWKCTRVEGSDWGSDPIDTDNCEHETFESHNMCLPVNQLFGGGQGVYGLASYPGVKIQYPEKN